VRPEEIVTTASGYSPTIAERLVSRLVRTTAGCLEFTGARTADGYGRIGRGGRHAGWERTHRVAWEIVNGPVPDGMCVLHRCDNPPCCETTHLFLGTRVENNTDRDLKGRTRAPDRHWARRLTDEQVGELRRLAPEVGNYTELARRFGITQQHARNLVLGKRRAA
jgi:hypothetical protein